jgi:hypothetical protein
LTWTIALLQRLGGATRFINPATREFSDQYARTREGVKIEYSNNPKPLAHKILALLIAAFAMVIAAIAVGWPRL